MGPTGFATEEELLADLARGIYVPDKVNAVASTNLRGNAHEFFDTVMSREGPRPSKFRAGAFADALIELQPFACLADMGNELRWFDGRVWKAGGEHRVKELACLALNTEITAPSSDNPTARVPTGQGNYLDHVTVFGFRELENQIRVKAQQWHDEWVTNKLELLPLANGVLDLQTRTLEPYDWHIHHFLAHLPMAYDPNAACPAFDQFVADTVAPREAPLVYELFGYCLWRDYTYKKAVMLTAPGDNGKSVLLDILEAFLGRENTSSIPLVALSESRFSAAALKGKLANICADLPDRAVRETGIFKMLTGHDALPYERKFQDPGQFRSYAKLVFSANKIPDTRDDTDAYFSRWVIIEFPWRFVKEPKEPGEKLSRDKGALLAELTAPGELSGVLNKALAALAKMRAQNGFSYDLAGEALKRDYVRRSNSLKAFIDEGCVLEPDKVTIVDDFYRHYLIYCERMGMAPKPVHVVGREIRQWHQIQRRYTKDGAGERRYGYFGVGVLADMTPDERLEQGFEAQKDLGAFNEQSAAQAVVGAPGPGSPGPQAVGGVPDNGRVVAMRAEAQAILDQLTDRHNGRVVQAALDYMLAKKATGDACSAHIVRGDVGQQLGDLRPDVTALVDTEFLVMERWVNVVHELKKVNRNEPGG